jgi:uncharacterized protein involved in outer membrane biogenesis
VAVHIDRNRLRAVLKWTGIVLGALVVVIVVALALIDWNALRGPVSRFASARLHRTVAIDHLDVHIWSLTPRATVSGLAIGNPFWEKRKTMLEVQRATVELKLLYLLRGDIVLPLVSIDKPRLYLHRTQSGQANWAFATPEGKQEKPSKPVQLPVVQRFMVHDGRVEIIDELRKLRFDGTLQAKEKAADDLAKPFRLEGKGELNDKPFSLKVAGGPLINLDPGEPYSFDGSLQASDIKVDVNGTLPKPFDLGRLTAKVKMSGQDLADLYYLSGLALPNSPPYQLATTVERNATNVKLTKISGKVGSSDVRGELSIDTGGERPRLEGDLASDRLKFSDMAVPLGGRVAAKQGTLDSDGKVPPPTPADQPLFPDASLQLNRVRAMDADVRYVAQAVDAGKMPLKRVSVHILLQKGVLNVQPFALEFPQGKLSGTARIDATLDVPQTDLDMRLTDLRLDQFVPKKPDAQPPLTGVMQARAKLHGTGASVHDVASTANGTITAIMPQGEIRAVFAELTGINVARGVGLLLAKDQEKTTLRCGIANFEVNDGIVQAQHIVFDTQDVLITGRGEVRLKTEALDLEIRGHPKKLRLVRLRTPIKIVGHLRKPAVTIDAGKTAGQAGIAAALGALIAPLAAVVAFVDPGLAKDADCAALFEEAKAQGAPPKAQPTVSSSGA